MVFMSRKTLYLCGIVLSLGTQCLLLPYLWKTCFLEINEFEEKLPIPLSWSFVELFMIKNFDS